MIDSALTVKINLFEMLSAKTGVDKSSSPLSAPTD